jgi:hypothetical protein
MNWSLMLAGLIFGLALAAIAIVRAIRDPNRRPYDGTHWGADNTGDNHHHHGGHDGGGHDGGGHDGGGGGGHH